MWLSHVSSRARIFKRFIARGPVACFVSHKSTYRALPEDSNCKMEPAMSSDGRTIVCYHPSVEVPHEHTKPIERREYNVEETEEQTMKAKFDPEVIEKQGPLFEKLSKMFYTTKHRWYPVGEYQRRRIPTNPPKER